MNACSCLTLILACIVYWQAREILRLAAAPDFPFDPRSAPACQPDRMEERHPLRRDQDRRPSRARSTCPSSSANRTVADQPWVAAVTVTINRRTTIELSAPFAVTVTIATPAATGRIMRSEPDTATAATLGTDEDAW